MMIIFLVLLAVGAVYLVNSMGQRAVQNRSEFINNFTSPKSDSFLKILKKRYTDGELSFLEYENIKNAFLESDS